MKIFFDYQAFALQNYGGISRYFCELITGINKTDDYKAHLSLLWSNNVHLRDYNIPTLPYPFPKRHRLLATSNKVYNSVDAKISRYDIYHATYFDNFLSRRIKSKAFITTFYDMTYERLSHKFVELSDDKWIVAQKKKIAQRASHLIAISESTKQDMIELLDIAPEKITVIYLGNSLNQIKNDITSINTVDKLDRPYLLYVGNRAGYKNFLPFLQAIAPILTRYQLTLICAGGGNFTVDEQKIFHSLALNQLVSYKVINDTVLPNLYKNAAAFVFPSLYEGFGIPILEAFSCNCPCVLSNTSSLPEVAGEAALYMDPNDKESMAHSVENILTDSVLRSELIQRGRQQLAHFSWQRTVNETLNLYNKLS